MMTVEETAKILAVVKAAYPNMYRDLDKAALNGILRLWANHFSGVPYPVMQQAVQSAIGKCRFCPTIAEINEEIGLMKSRLQEEIFAFGVSRERQQALNALYESIQVREPNTEAMLRQCNLLQGVMPKELTEGKHE